MFNTLASYLLGQTSSNNNAINNTTTDQQSNDNLEQAPATAAADNLKIKTTICDENDWLIVDHEDEDSEEDRRTDSEEELPTVEIKNCPLIYKSKRNGPPTSVSPNLMEESTADDQWFVTPPPCFTSTTGLQLESSPFENLLIEHPSMSVYHRNSNVHDVDEDIVVLDYVEESGTDGAILLANASVPRSRRRLEHHVSQQEILEQKLVRHAQKSQQQKQKQIMSRSSLERTNKLRDVNSKCRHQKRSDMQSSKVYSRVNNNRKC